MDIAFLVGRVLFGGYFLLAALNHFKNSAALSGYAASKGVPMARASVLLSGLLSLVGGLSVVTGYMPVVGVIALLLFLVPVTLAMHPYWKAVEPVQKMADHIQFQKNVALIGASLILLGLSTPWALSLSF